MFVDGEALRWYDPWLLFPNCPLGPGGGDRDEEARQDVPHDLQEGRASSLGTAAAAGSAATSVGDATRRARAETLQRLTSDTLSSERDASRSEAVLLAALRRGEHPSAATTTQRPHSRTAVASVSANRQSGLASTRSSERSALLHDNNNDDGDDHDGDNNSSSSGDDDRDDGLGLRRSATGARDVGAQARELRDFFGGAPARLGAREEPVLCPLDTHANPLVHIAAAAEVFAVVTAGVPQVLYIFDQLNNLPISSVVVSGTTYPAASTEDAAADSGASAAAVAAVVVRDCAVAPEDRVSLLSMDPTGHYCVLVFDSGKAVCFHIPHRAPCAPPPRRDATAAPEVTVDSVQGDGDGDEERRRRHRRQRLAESKSAARRWLRFDLRRRSADAAAASAHDSDEGGDAVSAAAACRPQGFSLVMDLPAPHAHRNHQQQQPQQQYARVTRPISFVPACVGWCRHMSGGGDDDVMDVDVDGQPLRSAATSSSLPITSPSAEVLLGALRGGAIVAARLTPTGVREARVVFTFSAPVANASVDSVVALRTAPAVVYGTGATRPARDAATTSAAAAAAATFRPHTHTPHFTSADDGGGGGGSGGGASRRGGAPLRHDGVFVPAAAAPTTAAAAAVRRWVVLVSLRNRLYVFSSPITASASVAGAAPPPLLTGRVEDAFACCAAGTQRCYVDVEADALSDYSGGECGGGVYSGAPSCIHANGGALVTRPEVRRGAPAGDAARAAESAESPCRLRVVDPSTAGAAPQLLASSPSRGVVHLVLPDAVPERAAGGAGRAPAEGTTLAAPATLPAAFYWQYGDVLVQGIVLYGAGGLEVGAKVWQLVHDSVGDAVDAGDRAADEEAGLSALLEEAVAETQTLGRRWPGDDDDDDGARGSARDAGAAGTAGGAGVATRQRSPSVVPALPSTMLLPISILSVVNVNACLRSVRGLLSASDAAHTTAHGRSGPVLTYTRAAVPLTASSANAGRHADAADGPAACRHPYLQFPWSEHLELSRDAVRRARRHPPRPRIAAEAEAEADDDGKAAAVSARSAPATMSVALLDGALARGDFDVETLRRLRAMAAAYVRRSPLLFDASPEALLRATAAEQHVTSPPPPRVRSPAAREGGRRARPPRRAVCSGVATGQHDGEVLVSLAASYSHLALSTTEGVFVVAHAAALPLEEAATAWRRALVYHAVVAATASSSSSSVSPAFTVVADAAAPDMFYAASTRRIARLQTAAPATSSAGQRQLVLQLLNAAARLERCGGAPASPCVATTTASTASPAAEAVVVVPSSLAHEVRLRGCLRQSEPAVGAWGQQSCGWDGVAAASVSSSHTVAPHSRSRSGTGEPLSALRRGTNGEVDEDNDNGAAPAASATLVPPLRHRHTPPPPSGAASSLSHRSSSSGANDGAVAQHGGGHDADTAPLSRRLSSASLDAAALPHRHAGSPIVSVMMDAAPSSPAPGRHSASASLSAALRTSSAAVTFTRARSVSFAPQAALDDDDDDDDDGGVREREAGAELASTSVPVLDTHRGVADAFRTALDAAGAASCAEDHDLLGFLRANPLLHVMMHEAARTGYHDASVAPCARSVRSGRHVRAVNVPGFGLLPGSVGLTPLPRGISPAQACMLLERPFGALLYTADHLYEMTLAACVSGTSSRRRGLSGQEIELLGIVRRAYGRYLLASRRYLEAAVQLGRAPERVRDHRDHHQHHDGGGAASLLTTVVELVQVFRASNSLEPLWLLLRLRLRQLESSREGVGGHALTVSVLATWLLALDLEGCSAARAGAQAERAPAPPPSYTRVEWIRQRYGLDDPRALLGDTLRRYGRFIDLSVLSTLLGRLAAAPEAVLVAELLGSPEASVATLALRQRNYLAGLVRLEALLVDPAARAPETQTLLQALVQEEPGLAGAATHAPPLRVVVGGRLSAAVEAAAGAGGEACVAAPLLSVLPVAPRNFAHPTHALTDLITRLAPLLLRCYPRRFVDGCLLTVVRERPDLVLHPRRLLPALLAYSVGSNESDAEASGSAVAVLRAVATARHTGSTCADTGAHDDRRCPPSSRSPTPSSSAEEISFDGDIQLSEPHVEDTALVAAAPPPSLSPEAPFTLTAEPTVPSPARRTGATESTSAPSRPSADVCCSDDDNEDVSVASGRGSAASSSDSAEAMLCEDGQPRRCGSSRSLTRRHRAAAMAAAAAAAARAAMVPSLTPDAVDDRPSTAPPNAVLAYLREVADPADAAGDADPVDAALLVAYATALERDGGDGALAAFAERVALRFVHAAAAAADAGGATAAGSRSGCPRSSVAPAAAYGLQHLFRLCARHRRWVGCVWMYLALGHHRDAVQLALTGVTGDAGVQLAVRLLQLLHERDAQHERAVRVGERPWRGCASLTSVTDVVARGAEGSDTQQQQQQRAAVRRSRRELWMLVVQHLIHGGGGDGGGGVGGGGARDGAQAALRLSLHAGIDGVDVTDVLPALPDTIVLAELQEQLLASLRGLSHRIRALRADATALGRDSRVLHHELNDVAQTPLLLPADARCVLCGQPALAHPFIVYPRCRHVMHASCYHSARHATRPPHAEAPLAAPSWSVGGSTAAPTCVAECLLCARQHLHRILDAPLSTVLAGDDARQPRPRVSLR